MFYIYALLDPETKYTKYIGKTSDPSKRLVEPVFKPRKKVKLTDEDVLQIRKLLREGNLNQPQIAKRFNVTQSTVSDIKRNKRRKNIQLATKSVV